MDLTFVGWIVLGLIAGIISGVVTGGRSLRGWMPSLAIGLVASVGTGWVLKEIGGLDSITTIWAAGVFATFSAIIIRLLIRTVTLGD